jgi:hypothetical protein
MNTDTMLHDVQTIVDVYFDERPPYKLLDVNEQEEDRGERFYQSFMKLFAQQQEEITWEFFQYTTFHQKQLVVEEVTPDEFLFETNSTIFNDLTGCALELPPQIKKTKKKSALSRVTPLCFRSSRTNFMNLFIRLSQNYHLQDKSQTMSYLLALAVGTGNIGDLLSALHLLIPVLLGDAQPISFCNTEIPVIFNLLSRYTITRDDETTLQKSIDRTLLRTCLNVNIDDMHHPDFKHVSFHYKKNKPILDRHLIFTILYEIDRIVADFENARALFGTKYFYQEIPFCIGPIQELVGSVFTPILTSLVQHSDLLANDRLISYCCVVLMRVLRLHVEQGRITNIDKSDRYSLLACAHKLIDYPEIKQEASRLLSCGYLYLRYDISGGTEQESSIDHIFYRMETNQIPNHLVAIYLLLVQTQLHGGAPTLKDSTRSHYRVILLSIVMEQLRIHEKLRFDRNRLNGFPFRLLIGSVSALLFDWRKRQAAPKLTDYELYLISKSSYYLQRLVHIIANRMAPINHSSLSAVCVLQGLMISTMKTYVMNAYLVLEYLFTIQDMSKILQLHTQFFECFCQMILGVDDPRVDLQRLRLTPHDQHSSNHLWKFFMEPLRARIQGDQDRLPLPVKCQLLFLASQIIPLLMKNADYTDYDANQLLEYFDQLRSNLLKQALNEQQNVHELIRSLGDCLLQLYIPQLRNGDGRRYYYEYASLLHTLMLHTAKDPEQPLTRLLIKLLQDDGKLLKRIKKVMALLSIWIDIPCGIDMANIGDAVIYHQHVGRICAMQSNTCSISVQGAIINQVESDQIRLIPPYHTSSHSTPFISQQQLILLLSRVLAILNRTKCDDITRLSISIFRTYIARALLYCDPSMLSCRSLIPIALRGYDMDTQSSLNQLQNQVWALSNMLLLTQQQPPRDEDRTPVPHEWLPDFMVKPSSQPYELTNSMIKVLGTPQPVMLRSNRHVSCTQATNLYFEIQIVESNPNSILCFGVAPFTHDMSGLPGWNDGSVGYHTHQDRIYQSHPHQYTSNVVDHTVHHTIVPGDIYKCTISNDYVISFSKNGEQIGHIPLPSHRTKYFTVMWLSGTNTCVKVRFGIKPIQESSPIHTSVKTPLLLPYYERIFYAMNVIQDDGDDEKRSIPYEDDTRTTSKFLQKGDIVQTTHDAKALSNSSNHCIADQLAIVEDIIIRHDHVRVKCVDQVFDTISNAMVLGNNIDHKLAIKNIIDHITQVNEYICTRLVRKAIRMISDIRDHLNPSLFNILVEKNDQPSCIFNNPLQDESSIDQLIDIFVHDYLNPMIDRVHVYSTMNQTLKPETIYVVHIPGACGLVIDFDRTSSFGNEDYQTALEIMVPKGDKSYQLAYRFGKMDEIAENRHRIIIPRYDRIQIRLTVPSKPFDVRLAFSIYALSEPVTDAIVTSNNALNPMVPMHIMKMILTSGLYHDRIYELVEWSLKYMLLPTSYVLPVSIEMCQLALKLLNDERVHDEFISHCQELIQLLIKRIGILLKYYDSTWYEDRLCIMIDVSSRLSIDDSVPTELTNKIIYQRYLDHVDSDHLKRALVQTNEKYLHAEFFTSAVHDESDDDTDITTAQEDEHHHDEPDQLIQIIQALHQPLILRNLFNIHDDQSLAYYLCHNRNLISNQFKGMLLYEDIAVLQANTLIQKKQDLIKVPEMKNPVYMDHSSVEIAPLSLMKQVFDGLHLVPPLKLRTHYRPRDQQDVYMTLAGRIKDGDTVIKYDHAQLMNALFTEIDGDRNRCGLFVSTDEDLFIPNPQFTTKSQLYYFEFLGRLVGIALLTKFKHPHKWHSSVWSALVDDERTFVTTPQLSAMRKGLHQVITTPIANLLRVFEWYELRDILI